MNPDYEKHSGENDLDYAMRLIAIKKELKPGDLDWCDIVELLGLDYNPDSLRKSQDSPFGGLAVYKEMQKRIINSGDKELKKTLKSEFGEFEFETPRDRNGEFEPVIVPKNKRDVSGIEDKIIYKEVDFETSIKYNTAMTSSCKIPKGRLKFYDDLNKKGFDYAYKKHKQKRITVKKIISKLIPKKIKKYLKK